MAGSTYQYHLLTPSGRNITLPASHYFIRVDNPLYSVTNTLLVTTPADLDTETSLIISDTRTEPQFTSQVQINSYQPDEIRIIANREVLVAGGNTAKYQIKFLNQGKVLDGIVDTRNVRVSLVGLDAENGYFSLDKTTNTITSSKEG